MKRRLLILFVLLTVATPLAFFARFEAFSEHLEEDLKFDNALANSAKHAYAAAHIYDALRSVGISPDASEYIVLNLGEMNEYLETIFKISEPDSTREIMKDMYNNQAGVLIAEWARANDATLRDTVIRLAQDEVLAVSSYKVPHSGPEVFEDYPQSVQHASRWFCEQQKHIKASVNQGLDRSK
jgi:hypothetical protein